MTADQLLRELFVNHWLMTTIFFPPITAAYAWITDQFTWWLMSSIYTVTVWAAVRAK